MNNEAKKMGDMFMGAGRRYKVSNPELALDKFKKAREEYYQAGYTPGINSADSEINSLLKKLKLRK